MYQPVQMHGLVMCLLGSQLIPTGAMQPYCTLKICCGDEDKNSKGLGEKVHFKAIFLLTEMLYLQTKLSPTQEPHALILFMFRRSLEDSLKYADPALLDLKKLIKTTPSSWLKQLCFSQKALQTAQKVMKIILSISVWSVHLQRRLVQVKVSTSVNENNS